MTHKTRAVRYLTLAQFILSQPSEQFDQRQWAYGEYGRFPCGTPGCIGGHCAAMLGWERVDEIAEKKIFCVARAYLGLSGDEADVLFRGDAPWQTRDEAVSELIRRSQAESRKALAEARRA